MANVDEKVMAAVDAAIKKNPDVSGDELFGMAKSINSSIGKLSRRQFHARYPLQIKRNMKLGKRSRSTTKKKVAPSERKAVSAQTSAPDGGATKDGIRSVLLKFATALAAAETRKDAVFVVSSVDRYVDDVLKAVGSGK